jgi:hypothetical protein
VVGVVHGVLVGLLNRVGDERKLGIAHQKEKNYFRINENNLFYGRTKTSKTDVLMSIYLRFVTGWLRFMQLSRDLNESENL